MAISTLLNVPDGDAGRNAFAFDHAMAHRDVMAIMAPLDQWSAMPYFIEPTDWKASPANDWNLDHQQAHNDYASYLPAYSAASVAGFTWQHILVDSNLADQASLQWWTFLNHQDHFLANSIVLPLPFALATVPWWALPHRRAMVFW